MVTGPWANEIWDGQRRDGEISYTHLKVYSKNAIDYMRSLVFIVPIWSNS